MSNVLFELKQDAWLSDNPAEKWGEFTSGFCESCNDEDKSEIFDDLECSFKKYGKEKDCRLIQEYLEENRNRNKL